ncbi:hypothetical protein H4R22_001078 [Coemansia sp. RSA 1290]|nr:hypothetical protein H4R22_001078 [Coemansia sp. RSA 1290]KAJ2649681.1 hypothetical protein IWW40_003022 [Coemansia sp. RSA 1250]
MKLQTGGLRAPYIMLAATIVICSLLHMAYAESSTENLSDYPAVLYVATPFTLCFGALLTEQTVITDARCLHPFSNGDGAPDKVKGVLGPDYLMVGVPTTNLSATMHNVLLSTQVYTNIDQAGSRAATFFGLVANYVDNSTFYGVNTSAVHAYYPQSEYVDSAEQNFDVGILTLKRPIKTSQLAQLQLDDVDADMSGLNALGFAAPATTNDPATLQMLYQGVDLTTVKITPVSSKSRSDCDSDYQKAYDLKNMHSFHGHKLPDSNSPVYCSSFYDNVTKCALDTSISIDNAASSNYSTNLNSTILFVKSGSTIRVVSLGLPHVVEERSGSSSSCSSNGFVHFPRIGIYTDWIGWATGGSIASNGSWTSKPLSEDVISALFDSGGTSLSPSTVILAFAISIAAIISTYL